MCECVEVCTVCVCVGVRVSACVCVCVSEALAEKDRCAEFPPALREG